MKQPIACLITDTHLTTFNKDLVADIFRQYISLLQKLKLQEGFHLGDIFTSRVAQPLELAKFFDTVILKMFQDAAITLNCIPGNHDKVHLDDEYSYLSPFKNKPFLNLIETYQIIPTTQESILMIPYFKEDGKYCDYLSDSIKELGKDVKNTYLGTHIAVNGIHNNDGTLVNNGISLKLFKPFKKVFTGHYHDQSIVGNCYYIGSSHQAKFGEDEKKGFTVIYDDGTHKQIQSNFKKFIKVIIDVNNPDEVDQAKKQYTNSKDNIRFELKGSGTSLAAINKSDFEKVGIEITYKKDDIIVADNEEEMVEFKSYDKESLSIIYDEFSAINEYQDTIIDKQYLKKI